METPPTKLFLVLFISLLGCACVSSVTDPNDLRVLIDFKNGLKNPDLLKWPDGDAGDPCGPPQWPHVFCSNGRVTQIQVSGLGLQGQLPPNFNQLDKLQNLGLQKNNFTGNLPTFRGLSDLEFAYLDYNSFDTIPSDFFRGLTSLRVLSLDGNPLNQSLGWALPDDLSEATQLVNFSAVGTNLIGPLPDFLGSLPSLSSLKLSHNRLTGTIPITFADSMLQELWLNDQDNGGMTGPINVVSSMHGLTSLWLHGNQFTGSIPDDIGELTSLRELNLNGNRLVGLIPSGLADMNLQKLDLNNNMFMGPVPKFRAKSATWDSNSFCLNTPGEECAPDVSALLDFLQDLDYPVKLASDWTGNDPCARPWQGITCNSMREVSVLNLQHLGLNGTLSPALANLSSLIEIHLESNNLHGLVPDNLTKLPSLRVLNLKGNSFIPPLPNFRAHVKVVTDNNPKFQGNPSSTDEIQPDSSNSGSDSTRAPTGLRPEKSKILPISAIVGGSIICAFVIVVVIYCCRRSKKTKPLLPQVSSYPNDPSNMVKTAFTDACTVCPSKSEIHTSYGYESGKMNSPVSLNVLCQATGNFSKENELGRGGFGVVYKGKMEDGTELAVKRMVVGVTRNTALDEFRSEIKVLSKVRHRHLVSLLGYSAEGEERLLVYEYMAQGALSQHLFQWKSLGLEPLSWKRRLCIALDVARGIEYLHTLAHQSFIHRDLKSANILLDREFRAKVADFGFMKLAPDGDMSVATRLAGTFGYLAPEYAVTGKITTKVDVYSFGVVLMELLTGMTALDEERPKEVRYLAEWFWRVKSDKKLVIASIDPALDAKEDIYETIYDIAALAGHCTARDPDHRPEMGHAVSVLRQLVEKWRPYEEETDEGLPLPQKLVGWREEGGGSRKFSYVSAGSVPAGFADTFTSNDAR